jgi:hypothetical protein
MAEVMEELDAERDQLLDNDDGLVGRVKDVKEVENRLRHRLLPRNAWRLMPFFELFLSAPKDELHQWYLGLFGDHIVPAVLYCYTQVLRHPDLINSKRIPLVTTARLEAVWKRLSDQLASVVADTSMITLITAYSAHFHDIYIDSKENAKMTGDRMKMLMLTLPFMVRDLIALEVNSSLYIIVYTLQIQVHTSMYIVYTSMYIVYTSMYIVYTSIYIAHCTHVHIYKYIRAHTLTY